ncbi:alpha/beta hydrolase [Rhizobium sp. Root73]|uniref:alpha/beta fold hydrolase n=1 Tax=unclassified Rhizobium TaxID=2613769 RepID=UPI000712C926|nr:MULTISPECIES: alpha/beta hydrolase [unclassified Rhizobium]KQV37486.1 alpha/beta hydrolase [Rhizobium sp. Root1204]KQY18422.1 alpha/beta hydrolase [Rhizobium sp. Root1334]KRC13911.1 alpha/beta hydrolase [Rhizobium sp. Root73]
MKAVLKVLCALFLFAAAPAVAAERWQQLPAPAPMSKADKTGTAPVNGIDMYYAVYGSGPPVLLIHGGLGYADIWGAQIADLSKDHTVIVAESRGHGRSTRNADPYSYDLMSSDYLALLDYLKIGKTAIVGWSDGGIIGLDIAIHHPERLTKLFAQAANSKIDGVIPTVMENKTFATYIEKAGEVYKKISPTPAEYDAFVTQISNMWASQPNWSDDDLKKITTPTTIVLGDHDEAISREHTDYLAKTIPGAELIILKDASHFAMLQDPEGYNKAVRDFIDR